MEPLHIERTRVQIEDCACTYPGGVQALRPTSLVVEPGEVLALLGPSGCGKTTLLRVVAGLIEPDAGGRVRFGTQDVTHVPIEQRDVGMVFQHYALFPQMNVVENIGYGLRVRRLGKDEIERRVGELIEMMRLGGLEARRPAELSGGQRQRVALARAVAVRPRVLLLDEPLTALDARLKIALRDELARWLRQLGITTIHVTHDQNEALALADRLAVMHAGSIIQVGDGESLYRRPAHPFVAEFLGRINRLGRSEADRREGVLRIGGRAIAVPLEARDDDSVFVRPEDLRISATTEHDCQARIVQRTFLGDRVQIRLQLDDQPELVVDLPRDSPVRLGDAVNIDIDPKAILPSQGHQP